MNEQKRMIVAVVLSGAILFGWQALFAPKQGPLNQNNKIVKNEDGSSSAQPQTITGISQNNNPAKQEVAAVPTRQLTLVNGEKTVTLDNQLNFRDYLNTNKYNLFDLMGQKDVFTLEVETRADQYEKINLKITSKDGNSFKGITADGMVQISASLDEKGFLRFSLSSNEPKKYRFTLKSKPITEEEASEMGMTVRYGTQRQYLVFSKSIERIDVGDDEFVQDVGLKWFGFDFNYHLFSLIFDQSNSFKYSSRTDGSLVLTMNNPVGSLNGQFLFTQKDYDELVSFGNGLKASVDFGIFGILAVPILRCLQFFHEFIPNYGFAIILLTIAFKIVTFPLVYKSYSSMKKMQKIQPQLKKIQEKYKSEPQRVQKETMELFKKNGANPLGGCIPLLLQLPIFFAFYQVLYNAVELVGAPFVGWIHDLSAKDPYYILPILMVLSMVLQQKFTPSPTADPIQKKIMLFMPLIFGFFMKDLPSGLSLYILVSTLFGIGQQILVYRNTD